MSDFEPVKDKYGNEPGTPGWRTLNDTWVYCGSTGGRKMYQKVIGNHVMPDVISVDATVEPKNKKGYYD